jgi:hypothetical protein
MAAPVAAAASRRAAVGGGSGIGALQRQRRNPIAPRATNNSKETPNSTAATKAELAGLEAGISAIQAALALQERLTGGGARRRAVAGGGHPHPSHHPHNHGHQRPVTTTKQREWKRVSIRGKAAGEREVVEEREREDEEGGGNGVSSSSSWSLRSYLALPVEQYSVLDPRFIRRLSPDEVERIKDDEGGGGGGASSSSSSSSSSSCFRLTVPLSDVVGMDIVVEVDVEVEVDQEEATSTISSSPGVTFRADRLRLAGAALAPGGPAFALSRAEVELRLEARLSSKSDRSSKKQTRPLRLEADARVSLRVPPPLSAAPAPLLGATGSLVARMAMRALLPPFLDLLAADYARWAGEERRKGLSGDGAGGGQGGRAAALDAAAVGSLMVGGRGVSGASEEVVVVSEVLDGGRR